MPRPPKCRRVEQFPGVTYFKPSGIPVSELTEVVLTVEEFESIRLRDLEGLEQEECAEKWLCHGPLPQGSCSRPASSLRPGERSCA